MTNYKPMIHKQFIYLLLFLFAAVFLAKPSLTAERTPEKRDRKVKVVYIDPSYGGWEIGPVFGPGQFGKSLTLGIARRLQVLLEAEGWNVILSRADDQFVALDKRVIQARIKHADCYIALKTSGTSKDCIHIRTAPPPSKRGGQKQDKRKTEDIKEMREEIGSILNELAADAKYKESRTLAESLLRKLRQSSVLNCVTQTTGKDYVLANAAMPIVMMDFGIASMTDKQLYLADPASLESLAQSLVAAIREYTDSRGQRSSAQ